MSNDATSLGVGRNPLHLHLVDEPAAVEEQPAVQAQPAVDPPRVRSAEELWSWGLEAERKGLILVVMGDEPANRHGNELLSYARRLFEEALSRLS